MSESGHIDDPRCAEALDVVEAKMGADGWRAEISHGGSLASWGPGTRKGTHPYVTADALMVLRAAGRLPRTAR